MGVLPPTVEMSDDDIKFFKRFVFPQPELTESQMEAFQTLKEAVKEFNCDDYMLKRFLRARSYDPVQAEAMIREERVWMEESAPKKCRFETLARLLSFKTVVLRPEIRDRYNRPLIILSGKYYNPSLSSDMDAMVDFFIWGMELIKKSIKPPQPQFVLILDLAGWGLRNFNVKLAN